MTKPLLILRLEAPYQAWGYGSRWDYRKTNNEPTKSGIVGLLANALGYPRMDPRIEELSKKIKVSIRVEHEGKVSTDYHIVLGPHLRSDHSIRDETLQSWRYYLEDAVFLIIISSAEKKLLETLRDALKKPANPIFLGRKTCVPTRPLFVELTESYNSDLEVIQSYPYSPLTKYLRKKEQLKAAKKIRYILDDPAGDKYQMDEVRNNEGKLFDPRAFREGWIDVPKELSYDVLKNEPLEEIFEDPDQEDIATPKTTPLSGLIDNEYDKQYGFDSPLKEEAVLQSLEKENENK